MPRKEFQIGEVLTAANVNTFLMDQAVMSFDDDAARGSAIPTPVEGMTTYLADSKELELYNGTDWVTASGAPTYLTDGTEGFTAVSAGTAGLTYQPVSHNYIINGAFDVWQRGTSFSGNTFTADRWFVESDAAAAAASRQTFTPGAAPTSDNEGSFFLRASKDSGGTYLAAIYKVEDVRSLPGGRPATISLWAKASANATLQLSMRQNFGSGGSALTAQNANRNITTNWQRLTFTFTPPSFSGKTIGANSFFSPVFQILTTGAIDLDIWGVQLEAGSVATPFKRHAPSLQGELAACQRYYERITGARWAIAGDNNSWTALIPFATTKRTSPSVLTSATDANYGTVWRLGKAGVANLNKTGTVTIAFSSGPNHTTLQLTVATYDGIANTLNDISGLFFESSAEL